LVKPNVSLAWQDNSTNETGFKIYHYDSLLYTTLANTTTYSHQVNCNRDSHLYQVRSKNACGDSAFSNSCSVQCADTAPAPATGLVPQGQPFPDNQNIPLSWRNISNWGLNCTGNNNQYLVYYCQAGTAGCSPTSVPKTNQCLPVSSDISTSSCKIVGPLSWNSTYYWKVITGNGALANEAFGSFRIASPSAWWQTKTGDVYGRAGITSPIWRTVPDAQRYLSLENPPLGPNSGLVASLNTNSNDFSSDGGITGKGEDQATQTDFPTSRHQALAADLTPLLDDYSYAQLSHLVDLAIKKDNKQESYNPEVRVITGAINGSSIEKEELTANPSSLSLYYYPPLDAGAVSLDDGFSVGANEKFIVFVEDDLHINADISVNTANGGFLAFVVSGDIEIAASVTQVQGVYFANGSLTVESKGDTSEQQFNGQGIFVAKQGVELKRSFRDTRNASQPTEVFTFDPAYLFTVPRVFREKPYLWQEVVP